jgi:hypothetical protein
LALSQTNARPGNGLVSACYTDVWKCASSLRCRFNEEMTVREMSWCLKTRARKREARIWNLGTSPALDENIFLVGIAVFCRPVRNSQVPGGREELFVLACCAVTHTNGLVWHWT